MGSGISQRISSLKFAIISVLNLHCSTWLENLYISRQQTKTTCQDWILRQEVSGAYTNKLHFFDVRVFNPSAPSYKSTPLSQFYIRHEHEKQCAYEQCVREIKMGPHATCFNISSGMSKVVILAHKWLASLLFYRWNEPYSIIISRLRCCLSFSLLRSAILWLRGSWSPSKCNDNPHTILNLIIHEG